MMSVVYRRNVVFAFICIMFIFAASCSNKENLFMSGIAIKKRAKPDAEITLSPYESITSATLDIARSIQVKIDSFLVFSTASNAFSFMVYNENADSVVLVFPSKGRGPDEQLLSTITQVRRNNGSVEIDVLGLNEHTILTIDFYRSIAQRHPVVIKRTELPQNTTYAHSFGESLAGIVLFDEYGYTLQVFNAGSMEREDLMIPFGFDVDLGFVTSTCIMKEDGTKCLWAMRWMNKFNILDLENLNKSASFSTARRIVTDKQLYADISEMHPASVTTYYTGAQVTNSDVFLLYRGFSNDEANNRKQMEIQNFSWEGHFKNRYLIKEIVDSFVVSDDASTVYGYSWDESKIYKYSLMPLE